MQRSHVISDNVFHLALCYGRSQHYDKRAMWDSLIDHVPLDNPAIICGDFNNVLNPEKRVRGRVPLEREVQ